MLGAYDWAARMANGIDKLRTRTARYFEQTTEQMDEDIIPSVLPII
jgi:hypothetical protein